MNKYLLNLDDFDPEKLLSNWVWLLPERVSLVGISCFGDLFVRTETGAILWLDTLEAHVYQVAASAEEWHRKLGSPESIDQWFWPGFVEALERHAMFLSAGECYAWRIHPILGGPMEIANLMPLGLFPYHVVISQLHRLPEGFCPTGFGIEGDIST